MELTKAQSLIISEALSCFQNQIEEDLEKIVYTKDILGTEGLERCKGLYEKQLKEINELQKIIDNV